MKNKIRNHKYFKPVSYTLFFMFVFTVFLFVTFPGELIKKRIIAEIESATPFQAEIESVNISPSLSVKLSGVKLYKSKDRFLVLNNLSVRPSIFSVVTDSPKFPFKAELLGGEIEGSLSFNKANGTIREIDATVTQVAIDSIPSFLNADGENAFSLGGVLNGELFVRFDPRAKGDFEFVVEGFEVDKVQLKGFTLPGLAELTTVFRGNIDGETTKIEELNVTGEGIELQITGTAPLLWDIPGGGVLDLGYRLEMTGPKMAKYKSLLAPYLATQGDGSLGGKILGTVNNPRFEKSALKRF